MIEVVLMGEDGTPHVYRCASVASIKDLYSVPGTKGYTTVPDPNNPTTKGQKPSEMEVSRYVVYEKASDGSWNRVRSYVAERAAVQAAESYKKTYGRETKVEPEQGTGVA